MTPVLSSADIAIGDMVRVDGKLGTITSVGDAAARVRIDRRIRAVKYQRVVREGYLRVARPHPNMYKLDAKERWRVAAPPTDLIAISPNGRLEIAPETFVTREDEVIAAMREVARWLRTKPQETP